MDPKLEKIARDYRQGKVPTTASVKAALGRIADVTVEIDAATLSVLLATSMGAMTQNIFASDRLAIIQDAVEKSTKILASKIK